MTGKAGRSGAGRPTGNRGGSGKAGTGRSVPARSAGSAGGGTASGSLYERYKDALRRAHVAALRDRNEAAIDAYGEAAMIAPDRALPHASIGGIFVKMGRLDEAITAYDRALELGPRDETALRGMAEAFSRAGRRTEAAAALDDLSARDGDQGLPVLVCFGVPTSAVAAIDPITGAAAWQVDAPSIDNPAASVVRTSGRSWLFDVQPVPIEIDIGGGPRRPGEDITGGWCGTPDPFPCTVIGARERFPDAVPAFAGVMAAGWAAWIDNGTVKAIQLP